MSSHNYNLDLWHLDSKLQKRTIKKKKNTPSFSAQKKF